MLEIKWFLHHVVQLTAHLSYIVNVSSSSVMLRTQGTALFSSMLFGCLWECQDKTERVRSVSQSSSTALLITGQCFCYDGSTLV